MKHRRINEKQSLIRKGFRLLASRPGYQVAFASAAFLGVTAMTGTLVNQTPAPAAGQNASHDRVAAVVADAMGASAIGSSDSARAEAPPPVATPAQAKPTQAQAKPTQAPTKEAPPPPPAPPSAKTLDYEYQTQPNSYWCGPAATRIVLTARGKSFGQDYIANQLGTTVNGTNSANDTTRVLNSLGGTDFYHTREIPGPSATPAEMDRLQADAVHAISNGYAIVANVAGSATDTAGGWHGYGGGHYVAIVGYQDDGRTVKIADPANANVSSYWVTTIDMANWMATRGYSAGS